MEKIEKAETNTAKTEEVGIYTARTEDGRYIYIINGIYFNQKYAKTSDEAIEKAHEMIKKIKMIKNILI